MKLYFGYYHVFINFFYASIHSAIVYVIPLCSFSHPSSEIVFGDSGKTGDYWTMSVCSFTSIIFIANLKLLIY